MIIGNGNPCTWIDQGCRYIAIGKFMIIISNIRNRSFLFCNVFKQIDHGCRSKCSATIIFCNDKFYIICLFRFIKMNAFCFPIIRPICGCACQIPRCSIHTDIDFYIFGTPITAVIAWYIL